MIACWCSLEEAGGREDIQVSVIMACGGPGDF